jgi:hypothetical protein
MNENVDPGRDEWLGALLRELDAPEHRPEFHAQLRRRLAEERSAATRRAWLRWSARGAGLAGAAAGAAARGGLPTGGRGPSLGGPRPAEAAVVKAHVRNALALLRTLSGVLVADGPGTGGPVRFRFALDAAGDLRLEGPRAGDVETYDASTGVVRSAQHSASVGGSALFYAERTGVAPGPPDQGPPNWVLPQEYGAYVRALLAAGSPAVREVVYRGRPAWRVDVDTRPNAIAPRLSGDHLRITVDRSSGMPVRIVETKHGRVVSTLRIDQLAVDRKLPRGEFRLAFPAGAAVMRSDDGFRRLPLPRVAAAAGYRPLVPSWLPDGYRLAAAAVARESAPTGKEGGNPPSRMVVSLSYRRGIDQVLVTTRLRGRGHWSDPLASAEGFVDAPEPVTLRSGALRGAGAQVVLAPRGIPHLWSLGRGLVVTVGGDLGRDQLVRVASSLRRR